MSPVSEYPAADPAQARAHFAARRAHETDCADVSQALASGAADFILLDVRGPEAFARGHVPGAVNLPHREIGEERLASYPADMLFVVYCAGPHCNGASKAALRLSEIGRPVKEMIGGVTGWLDEGFRLASGERSDPVKNQQWKRFGFAYSRPGRVSPFLVDERPETRQMSTESGSNGAVRTEIREHLLLITISRPEKLNAFSPEMLDGLSDAYTRLEEDPDLWCALLCAEGPHFTSGLELDRLAPRMAAGGPLFPIGRVDPTDLRPPRRTKPVLCAVQGICFTLGIELMLAADIAVAADDCRFAQLEVRRGIFASQGGCLRMVERAGWGNAQRYLLTGDEFDAGEAWRLGFVQEVVPAGSQCRRALELAERVASRAPLAVRASLAASRSFSEHGMAVAAAGLDAAQKALFATADAAEGLRSFRERREGHFEGR